MIALIALVVVLPLRINVGVGGTSCTSTRCSPCTRARA